MVSSQPEDLRLLRFKMCSYFIGVVVSYEVMCSYFIGVVVSYEVMCSDGSSG